VEVTVLLGLLFALLIGAAAGLRSLMPIAALRFPKHDWTSVVTAILALGELVGDKLPNAPSRLFPPSLIFRLIVGAYAGAVVGSAHGASPVLGAGLGIVGAATGSYVGYAVRATAAKQLPSSALWFALAEDALAILLSFSIALHSL
jgi:uncharacterized membrane protein